MIRMVRVTRPGTSMLAAMHKYTLLLTLLLVNDVGYCDGLEFDGDRYSGAKVVLQLTREQYGHREIALNEEQRTAIKLATGKYITKLSLWTIAEAKDSCTCELANIAIQYGDYAVVPLWLVSEMKDMSDRHYKEFSKEYYDLEYRIDGIVAFRKQAVYISVILGVIALAATLFIVRRLRLTNR